ncbi:MAG: hypothetical protein AB202_01170 [Parcubacteria bacterium C7867-007]|nr:MAG: hypothetical protein AB202_01170 [Parcubacteria bacterium C7867-007]
MGSKYGLSAWHKIKHWLNTMRPDQTLYFNEREVWFCYLGANVGYEQNGRGREFLRPVIIVKKYNKNLFLGIPLTSKVKSTPYYFPLGVIRGSTSAAILIQTRSLSSRRLINKIAKIDVCTFNKMKTAAMTCVFGD